MEFEVRFKGSPAQFAAMVKIFANRVFLATGYKFAYRIQGEDVSENALVAYIEFRDGNPPKRGWITAQRIPRNQTLLIISAQDEDWAVVQPRWEALRDELVRQGWVAGATAGASGPEGGRPRNPIDSWAWEQVNILKRPRRIVFEEWRQRNAGAGRTLRDEARSWRHAIKADRNKQE
jgi:hypothetical protein